MTWISWRAAARFSAGGGDAGVGDGVCAQSGPTARKAAAKTAMIAWRIMAPWLHPGLYTTKQPLPNCCDKQIGQAVLSRSTCPAHNGALQADLRNSVGLPNEWLKAAA